MQKKIQIAVISVVVAGFGLPGIAESTASDARVALSALTCAYAAEVLENNEDAEQFRSIGNFIIHEILSDIASGELTRAEVFESFPAIFGIFEGSEVNSENLDLFVAYLEQLVDEITKGGYERAGRGKSGVDLFNAKIYHAKDIFESEQCDEILASIAH